MDQPAASHDMLLRFLQVDTMHSAGSAAVIPSRIGSEIETVLGATHPNGTSLSDLLKLASGGLTDPDELGTGSTEGGGGGGIVIGGGGGDDIEHERKYGPRKTAALVVLLLLLGGAVWAILHWRRHRRRERYRRLKGKCRAGPRSHRRREEEEEDEEEEQVGLRTRRAAAASEPIPTIAVFDVGEYEDDMRSDGAEGGGGRDDERKRSSSGVRRSGGRGGGRSSLGDDDDDDERGDRAGDLGRAAEDANPFREDARRRYEKSMRS